MNSIFKKFGKEIKNCKTAEEAILASNLNFEVDKLPANYEKSNGELVSTGKYHTIRTDNENYLGTVGEGYNVCQNIECFEFFDKVVDTHEDIVYTSVGIIGNGQKMWVQAKMPDYIKVGNNDVTEMFVTLINSHDGSTSIQAKLTPIRIICQNTFSAVLKDCKSSVSIQHSVSYKQRLNEAHEILNISNKLTNELELIFNNWANKRITDDKAEKIIEKVLGLPEEEKGTRAKNSLMAAREFLMIGAGQNESTTKGTLYGVYNAVTGYLDHVKYNSAKAGDSNLKNNLFGNGEVLKKKAFELCLNYK
jgi:phage/plasmid-like protein (TIGR03299 family)